MYDHVVLSRETAHNALYLTRSTAGLRSDLDPDELQARISANLVRLRSEAGLSQVEVAAYLGIARSTFQNLETARHPIRIYYLVGLAGLYGVPLDELVPVVWEN